MILYSGIQNCVCCGSSIPAGQKVCSMCYGDVSYGRDGYYEEWAREQERKQEELNNQQEDDIHEHTSNA